MHVEEVESKVEVEALKWHSLITLLSFGGFFSGLQLQSKFFTTTSSMSVTLRCHATCLM